MLAIHRSWTFFWFDKSNHQQEKIAPLPNERSLNCTLINLVYLTEYTEWQWSLSGVHSIIVVKSAQPGECEGARRALHAQLLSLYLRSS